MIRGIGTDIIEVERIKKAIGRESFLHRVFSEAEIEIALQKNNPAQTLAGFFAAKEAFSKAMGTGFRSFSFRDVEIRKDELGKPRLFLSEKLKKLPGIQGITEMHVSISHNNGNALAFVILEE